MYDIILSISTIIYILVSALYIIKIRLNKKKDNVYIMQDFYKNINGVVIYPSKPRVFFGTHAKEKSDQFIAQWSKKNGFIEIKNTLFNNRLFRKEDYFVELYKLECIHFVHNCN